jgi:peptidoglycan/xylan/chitin deacetylase (PgdA/CDA1 family)
LGRSVLNAMGNFAPRIGQGGRLMIHELPPGWSARLRRLRVCLPWIVAAALVVGLVACYPKKPPPPPTANVYLTFDDGPSAYTPQILSVLEAAGARATFFVLGENATRYPSYVRQADAVGVIGDHTWDHRDLTTPSPAQIRWELESTADTIADLTGKWPALWRPPYGHFNLTVTQIASALGLSMRLWDVDPKDASNPGTDAIISTVLDNVRDGDIVLLHDGGDRSQTVAALPTIIDRLQDRGYQLATL